MKTYIITYDLLNPGQDYSDLHDAIKALANGYSKPLESFWIVNSSSSAIDIRDRLNAHIDANDKLFICSLGAQWAGNNLGKAIYDWLKKYWVSESVGA